MNNSLITTASDWMRSPNLSKRIAVVHAGPIGLSTAMLLARRNEVILQDARPDWVDRINAADLPPSLKEPNLQEQLTLHCEGLRATPFLHKAVEGADYVIVTTPTRFDKVFGSVDTTALDGVLHEVQFINPYATLVIASNPPVGYTQRRDDAVGLTASLIVMPTLLRPGRVFLDRWHPERLVIGECSPRAVHLAIMMRDCLLRPAVPYILTHATEAEAIFLFEQKRRLQKGFLSYAEVARYATRHGLELGQLIEGLALDGLPELGHVNTPDRLPWMQTVPYHLGDAPAARR